MIKILQKIPYIRKMNKTIFDLHEEIDTLRSKIDITDNIFMKFQEDRQSKNYQEVYEKETPLVSYCMATYNRGNLLFERSLKSILNQVYKNIEIIIIGDCCTDNTESFIKQMGDERIRFVNLPERGHYPEEPECRWMVAGTIPMNHALSMAKGDFITHLDDDDEHSPDRIKKLVEFIKKTRADLIWHPFRYETEKGKWLLNSAEHFRKNEATTSSIFYHNWFRQILWDIDAYKYREPGDWNRLRKIKYLGAKIARYPESLLKHFRERNQGKR